MLNRFKDFKREWEPAARPGQLARSHTDLVRAARQIIEGSGFRVATPADARETLELKDADKVAF